MIEQHIVMDRYVLVITFNLERKECSSDFKGLETAKQLHDKLKDISSSKCTRVSPLPACSLSGSPASQRWCFAIQACFGTSQFCGSEWEELGAGSQRSDSEEEGPSALETCHSALRDQEEQSDQSDSQPQTELFEEAAEGLHLLSDKLPPPGKFLLDVILLCVDEESPSLKDFLPVIGALKHMQIWHSAKMTIVTEHNAGWQKLASYLSAGVCEPSHVGACVDERDLWRGGVLIREKKFVSEVRFEGFSLKAHRRDRTGPSTHPGTPSYTDHKLPSEVFHYYRPVLDLVQLVTVTDLPLFLISSTEFELGLSTKSVKSKLLLDQLRTLRGKVGALFSLSCVVSAMAFSPAAQLSTHKWKEFMAKRPKALPVPDVEVKGENAHYFLLVQGTDAGVCKARMIHSANQINGAAALATVNGLIREKVLSFSGNATAEWLRSLPCFRGDQLLLRERRLAKVQTLVLEECLRRREEAQKPAALPVNDLKVLLSLAREQYLKMHDPALPTAPPAALEEKENRAAKARERADQRHAAYSDWPERSVLHNAENLQKSRQKSRSSMLGSGSSERLMGPKDGQRATSSLLDAKELLKHFTPEGLPSGELQPLHIQRGDHAFQLSPDLTPRKVTQLPFRKAASSHYHGIEFCLDERRALERDRGFVRLQSRLIRYETQTTCSREPCPLPFALSPAPSPAVLSEPGSVPDGESLQADAARLKRRSWEADATGPRKRLAKSESSESLGSQCSGGGSHPAVRALRQQPSRSQSSSGAPRRPPAGPKQQAPSRTHQPPSQGQAESRSQKHARMLEEVVVKMLHSHGITSEHKCFDACCQRLFDISKFYLKDLKTSRGLHEEMRKAANSNAKQVIDWVVEKASQK